MAGIGFTRSTLEPSPPRRTSEHVRTHLVRCYEEHLRVHKVPANFDIFARIEIRRPSRNRRKINSFHHRNQITNPRVQFTSVKS